MASFFELNGERLGAFATMSQAVGARADYVQGGGGNTSVKLDGGLMAIKASGFRLSDITPESAYAVLDGAALRAFYETHRESEFDDVEQAGSHAAKEATMTISGLLSLRPSVEAGFHSLLDRFVIHSHSVYCNLAACAAEGRDIVGKALANAPYSWGFVPYVDPGARLTFAVQGELARVAAETGMRPAVLFMQNHGVIVHADDAQQCTELHADVNARIASAFGVRGNAFPVSSLPAYIAERVRTGAYDKRFFIDEPLYPDQMVFLIGTLFFGPDAPDDGCCRLDLTTGALRFAMSESQTQTVTETIAAVLFIAELIERNGYTLSTMGDAAKRFIANWESEKYRKSLAGTGGK